MKPDIVVDVGNSRIKWGRCADGRVVEYASLPPDDLSAWEQQLKIWDLTTKCVGLPVRWAVSGVHPQRLDVLFEWLKQWGGPVLSVNSHHQLPISVQVDAPDQVGIDRLLNAVAVRSRVLRMHSFIIDAGSAVTVDWVDPNNTFRGGAIFPGLRLMTRALAQHTALLPLVEIQNPNPSLPGLSSGAAIKAGVFWAAAGGIKALVRQMAAQAKADRYKVFLTGGDATLLTPVMESDIILWPEMTLEGINLTAEAQP